MGGRAATTSDAAGQGRAKVKPWRPVAIAVALALSVGAAGAPRSHVAVAAFKREHPCPATGHARGACPGWVIDHREPLCAGGADDPRNMQWQTTEEARVKDKREWARCHALRRAPPP